MSSIAATTMEQDRQLARELVDKARMDGLDLVGPDGLFDRVAKQLASPRV